MANSKITLIMFFAACIAVALAIPAPQNPGAPRPIAPVARPAGAVDEALEGSDDKKDLEASQSVGYGYYGGGFPGAYYSTGYYPYSSYYGSSYYGGYPYSAYRGFGGLYGSYYY